jgi:hypothetical protein
MYSTPFSFDYTINFTQATRKYFYKFLKPLINNKKFRTPKVQRQPTPKTRGTLPN